MKPANFAAVYACLYPKLAEVVRAHGYALAAHGSMARDFDLVCVPWIESPGDPQLVVNAITETFAIFQVGEPEMRLHGRLVYTISLTFGECALDLSFLPAKDAERKRLVDDNAGLVRVVERSAMRIKELDLLFGRYILGMRSAVIEMEYGKGAEAAMAWIVNGLAGPGELPPENEADAQAYFDREIKAVDAGMEEVFAYFNAERGREKAV